MPHDQLPLNPAPVPSRHTGASHHRFHIAGPGGALSFSVEATLHAPWTVLFGPSGSGKSTVLRALAGLTDEPSAQFSRRDPETATWQALAAPGICMPPHQRALAYSPQQALLLPHLTVERNLRFPEELRGVRASASAVPDLSSLLQLGSLLPRFPHQLSAGERQRVALARALAVPGARLLLLDEPFAGVDRAQRDQLLPALQHYLHQRALPVLSVTHDPDEVLLLQAEVLRIQAGRLVAQGSPASTLADELQRLRHLLGSATTTSDHTA